MAVYVTLFPPGSFTNCLCHERALRNGTHAGRLNIYYTYIFGYCVDEEEVASELADYH